MKKALIDEQKIVFLKVKERNSILISLIVLVLFISYAITSCFLQSRETMKVFILVNSIISIIVFLFELYFLTQVIIPLHKKKVLFSKCLGSKINEEEIEIITFDHSIENYLGVDLLVLYASLENNKKAKYFLSEDIELSNTKKYKITTHHNVVISISEVETNG